MRGPFFSMIVVISAMALPTRLASAQGRDPAAAESLFRDGRAAAQKGDWETACPKFRESDRLDPAAGTVLNLADCEEHRGKLATAWELYRQVIETLPAGDDRAALVHQRVARLDARLPRLTIRFVGLAPAGTKVTRNQVELAGASLGTALPVDPGPCVVTVTSPGRLATTTQVAVAEGASTAIEVAVGAPTTEAPIHDNGVATVASSSGSGRTASWIAGGVGLVGLGVFGVAGALTLGQKRVVDDNCNGSTKACNQAGLDAADKGRTLGILTTTGLVVGVLGAGMGAYFLLSSSPEGTRATTVAATLSPLGPALNLVSSW